MNNYVNAVNYNNLHYLSQKTFFQIISLFFSLIYIIFWPLDIYGVILSSSLLLFALPGINKETLGVYFLLFGPTYLGIVFQSFGIYGVGAIASYIMGFVFVGLSLKKHLFKLKWKQAIIWLILVILVLSLSYFSGPRTEYSYDKYITFIYKTIITVIALAYLLTNAQVNMWQLGTLGIISGISYISITVYLNHYFFSTSDIFRLGMMKEISRTMNIRLSINTIAILICLGIIFVLCDIARFKQNNLFTVLPLIIGYVLLIYIGQRLFIILPVLVTILLLYCKPKNKGSIKLLSIAMILFLAAIVIFALSEDISFITAIIEPGKSIGERFNRAINWESAINRIKEKPLLGHGLGGYYVDGYSLPGEGTYAHNLFLELLSETGILGTIVIILPVLSMFKRYGTNLFQFKTVNGGAFFPLFLYAFLHSMVSHDLTQSFFLFGALAVIWAAAPLMKYQGAQEINECHFS
jgi:hypothetical protein